MRSNTKPKTETAIKYNDAAPTRLLGITRRNHFSPLHENAYDSRAGSSATDSATEDENLLNPPQESDEESDHHSNSEASTPKNPRSTSPGWSKQDPTPYFHQKHKRKPGNVYGGKAKKMGKFNAVQKARPPRNKTVFSDKFEPPAIIEFSKETALKLADETAFKHDAVPAKESIKKEEEVKFEHYPVPTLEIPPAQRSKTSGMVSLINSEIDDQLNRYAGKRGYETDLQDKKDGKPKLKRRKTTPEAEFLAPPEPSSSGVPVADLDPDDSLLQIPEDILSPGRSTANSQPTKCVVCLTVLRQTSVDEFKKKNRLPDNARLTTRQQDSLHRFHSKVDARNSWRERHYPDIDWAEVSRRFARHQSHILSIIDTTESSYYVARLRNETFHRGRKTAILVDERRAGETGARNLGYYGTRGQRAIGDWLLAEFSVLLRQRLKDHEDMKLAGGVGGYIQKILIPEMTQQLIMEDMRDDYDMEKGARARANDVISDASTDNELDVLFTPITKDDQTWTDVSNSRREERETKSWLARFVALESAQCGLLLSEEIEDVVPIDNDQGT